MTTIVIVLAVLTLTFIGYAQAKMTPSHIVLLVPVDKDQLIQSKRFTSAGKYIKS